MSTEVLIPSHTGLNDLPLSDHDLLRRFIQDNDEQAFSDIVQRYHGLVMSVCRRVTERAADADDAFQATFLALARRPRSIRHSTALSSWLYTVAWRTSQRLVKHRRQQPMQSLSGEPTQTDPGPLDQIASAQQLLVLDEELNQLPSKYRDVLVMTYFAQHSNQQIADQLQVSRGTIDGRLRRARNILRVRLARRGVSLGVLTVATGLLSESASATSPALLTATTELGIQTMSDRVPGTTDLSSLEHLVKPEAALMTSKIAVATIVCLSAAGGFWGLQGAGMFASEAPPTNITVPLPDTLAPAPDPAEATAATVLVSQVGSSQAGSNDRLQVRSAEEELALGSSHARITAWPTDAKPVEKWMYETLDTPVAELDFRGETPLSEILDFVLEEANRRHGTLGNDSFSYILWSDEITLLDQGIESLDEVLISDVRLNNVNLQSALRLIFEKTADPKLTYVIQDGVMKITTVDQAMSEDALITRIYPVGQLLAGTPDHWKRKTPSGGSGGGFFQLSDSTTDAPAQNDSGEDSKPPGVSERQWNRINAMGQLISLIQELTSPPAEWADVDGQGGTLRTFGDNLVIKQTFHVQLEIVRILNLLTDEVR